MKVALTKKQNDELQSALLAERMMRLSFPNPDAFLNPDKDAVTKRPFQLHWFNYQGKWYLFVVKAMPVLLVALEQ